MNQTPEAARQTLYPIREVSRLTGVNPITLRAWERRYGLLVPHRTDGGHRLYSLQDIERVRSVTQWIARGVPVSKVAGILDREDVDEAEAPLDEGAFSRYDFWQQRLDQALLQGDPLLLERLYAQLLTEVPLVTALVSVLRPLHRRLPKFGFTSKLAMVTAEIRTSELNAVDAEVVDLQALKDANIIGNKFVRAKIVLSGDVTKAVTVKGLAVTKGARAAIEAAGGKIED